MCVSGYLINSSFIHKKNNYIKVPEEKDTPYNNKRLVYGNLSQSFFKQTKTKLKQTKTKLYHVSVPYPRQKFEKET